MDFRPPAGMSLTWQHVRDLFSASKNPPSDSFSYPGYRYERLEDNIMAVQDEVVVDEAVVDESSRHGVVDAAMAKRVLRKIDMRLIPLLFITYGLNFMDKTILSSAAVFGLRDDTVRGTLISPTPPLSSSTPKEHPSLTHTLLRPSRARTTAGSRPSSISATSPGPTQPTS